MKRHYLILRLIRFNKRGKGYGSFYCQGLMDKLKEKGIQTLWLEVRESNPARSFMKAGILMRLIFVEVLSEIRWWTRKCCRDGMLSLA